MTILVESFAGYRRITLNRSERLNALTVEMAAALNSALDEVEADKSCRALLLTGAGRGFCAGQDLTEIVGAAPSDLTLEGERLGERLDVEDADRLAGIGRGRVVLVEIDDIGAISGAVQRAGQ